MDIVFIKELCIETVIGIYDWERKIKQFVCIDLELGTDISDASNSDVINDTVDYKAVSKELKSCLLYTSPSPRDATLSRMPSSA